MTSITLEKKSRAKLIKFNTAKSALKYFKIRLR